MKKGGPKRRRPAKAENLRSSRKKIARIQFLLRGKETQIASEILAKANHWMDVESKSHWTAMKRLGKDHSEVLKQIETIKQSGGEIIRSYNVNFGGDEVV